MTLTSVLLQTVAPALLPPPPQTNGAADADADAAQEEEYYATLGLPKYADADRVRAAYRKLSLQLHPDKVQQRRGHDDSAAAAAARYERVQAAHAVLSDDHQRQRYHQWNCSPARYQFVEQRHGLSNPVALHENLQRAKTLDRLRLLLLSLVLVALVLLQPVLVAAKVNAASDPSKLLHRTAWIAVLIPAWVLCGAYALLLLAGTAVAYKEESQRAHQHGERPPPLAAILEGDDPRQWVSLLLQLLEHAAWTAGGVALSLQWDRSPADQWDWNVAAIPFYAALALRCARQLRALRQWRRAVAAMVSVDRVQRNENITDWHDFVTAADTADGDDDSNNQERLHELLQRYVVVTTDATAVAAVLLAAQSQGATVTEDELEGLRVETSREHRAARRTVRALHASIGTAVAVHATFVALVAAKLGGQIDVSWWVVFVPFWVSWGWAWLRHFLACCCGGGPPGVDDGDDDDDDEDEREDHGHGEQHEEEIKEHKEKESDNERQPTTPAAEEVKCSVNFASPESDMDEFNKMVAVKGEEDDDVEEGKPIDINGTTTTTTNDDSNKPGEEQQERQSKDDKLQSSLAAEIAQQVQEAKAVLDNAAAASQPKENDGPSSSSSTDKQADKDEAHSADDEEEAFRRWQERMREDEGSEFMEEKMRALSGCCSFCFLLMLLCLVVAKLEQDYSDGGEPVDDKNGGDSFSAFWVLFPIFFLAGIVLLCCAGCIFAREGKSTLAPPTSSSTAAAAAANGTAATTTDSAPMVPPAAISVELSQHDGSAAVADSTASNIGSSHHADPTADVVSAAAAEEGTSHSNMDELD